MAVGLFNLYSVIYFVLTVYCILYYVVYENNKNGYIRCFLSSITYIIIYYINNYYKTQVRLRGHSGCPFSDMVAPAGADALQMRTGLQQSVPRPRSASPGRTSLIFFTEKSKCLPWALQPASLNQGTMSQILGDSLSLCHLRALSPRPLPPSSCPPLPLSLCSTPSLPPSRLSSSLIPTTCEVLEAERGRNQL